jgi:hypothetical protein
MRPPQKIAEMVSRLLREHREWLRTEGWKQMMERVEEIRRVDSTIIEKTELLPTLHLPVYCPKERKFLWICNVLNLPVEVIRDSLAQIWLFTVLKLAKQRCGSCGGVLMPVGYIYCSEGWMVKSKSPEVDIPPSEHPDREEVYIVLVNTVFGRKAVAMAPIENRKVGKLQWQGDERVCGRLVLPLPDIGELAKRLEEMAESEDKMYG